MIENNTKIVICIFLWFLIIGIVSAEGTTNYTPLISFSITGGVNNGGAEIAPPFTAVQTQENWIDGTATGSTTQTYSWRFETNNSQTDVTARYDPVVNATGNYSLKIVAPFLGPGNISLVTTGVGVRNATPSWNYEKYYIPIKPNTQYTGTVKIKTDSISNTYGYGAMANFVELDSSLGITSHHIQNSVFITGTTDWTQYNVTFTTGANARYMYVLGDIAYESGTAWYDDFQLIQSNTITPAKNGYIVPIISSESTIYNFDTANMTAGSFYAAGSSPALITGQGFKVIHSQITGINVSRMASAGTPTGDLRFSIRTDNGLQPSSTVIASYNFTQAQWEALPIGNVFVPLPCTLTPGTQYWWVMENNVASAGNFYKIDAAASGGTGGIQRAFSTDGGATWTLDTLNGYYSIDYLKNTEDVGITVNGVSFNVTANGSSVSDPNGYLPNTNVDLLRGFENWTFDLDDTTNVVQTSDVSQIASIMSPSYGSGSAANKSIVLNRWFKNTLSGYGYLGTASTDPSYPHNITFKQNFPAPIKNLEVESIIYDGDAVLKNVLISNDSVNWVTVISLSGSSGFVENKTTLSGFAGNTTIYLKASQDTAATQFILARLSMNATLDTTIPNQTVELLTVTGGQTAYINTSSFGNAPSALYDPSMKASISFIENELIDVPVVASFSSKNKSVATNSTGYGWEGLAPFTMEFTDTSSGSPTSWVWNYTMLGNGPVTFNSSAYSSVQYTFPNPGNYSISLNATSIYSSNISTQITWVNVTTPQPTSYFTANTSSGYIPLAVLFTDASPGYPDTWNWSVEDSGPIVNWYNFTAATDHNLTYTFTTPGSWRVNLSVQNISMMTEVSTSSMNITATNIPPIAAFTGFPPAGTTSTTFVFNDTSTGTVYSYNWTTGDGNNYTTRNLSHTYAANGIYNVNLTVTNDGGSSSIVHQFTVASFTVSTTISPTSGIVPLAVVFNESYSGLIPDSYYWNFGDGVTATTRNASHMYTTAGTFSINHSATNGSVTVWSNTSNAVHASLGTITAGFTASNSTFTSIPAITKFTDTSTTVNLTINTYSWNFGDGDTSADQSPLHIYNSFGVFNATLTASNTSEGISSVAYTTITITSLYPRNTSYNFILLQEFPLTIRIKDAVTLSLINDVDVTTDESTKSVATNGIYSETLSYGSHTFKFEKDGYSTTTTSLFVASNATYTVTMSPLSGVGSQNLNVLYPHETTFTITDLYGNRLQNISVTAQMTGTPIPGNWWNTLYGISTSISPVFNSTTMVSATDDYGKVAFPMVSSATYALTFTGSQFSGGYITKQVTADQLAITLMLPTTTSQMPTFKSTMINATLYANSTLDPTIYLTLAYNDTSMTTTLITFFVDFPNRTRLYQSISPATPLTNQTFTTSYAVANVKDNAYVWGYISNSTFGNSTKAQGITLNGPSGSMIDIMTYHSGWD